MKIVEDSSVREAKNYAEYGPPQTNPDGHVTETGLVTWKKLTEGSDQITVRVTSSVFASDEKIVAVIQHEVWELTELKKCIDKGNGVFGEHFARLVHTEERGLNLHSQAWDVADLRVLIMRAKTEQEREVLTAQLTKKMASFQRINAR